jgi:hypothetical protein
MTGKADFFAADPGDGPDDLKPDPDGGGDLPLGNN